MILICQKSLRDWRENKKELFVEGEKVIGEYIKLDDVFFQIVGVHKYIQGGGFETDGDIFIPLQHLKTFIIRVKTLVGSQLQPMMIQM